MHQLEQVPAFHPFTLAVELWQRAFWIPLFDIKVFLCPFLQLRVHKQTVTRTAARPCLTVALVQIFRRDGNIVSDTVHLAEIAILHVQRQHVVRHFGRAWNSQRRFCGVVPYFVPDQPVVQRRRRQRGAVRREAAVHYRITRVRITDGDLHIVGETMLVARQVFIGKHPVLTVFIITTVEIIHRAGKGIQIFSELFQATLILVIAGVQVVLRCGIDERRRLQFAQRGRRVQIVFPCAVFIERCFYHASKGEAGRFIGRAIALDINQATVRHLELHRTASVQRVRFSHSWRTVQRNFMLLTSGQVVSQRHGDGHRNVRIGLNGDLFLSRCPQAS